MRAAPPAATLDAMISRMPGRLSALGGLATILLVGGFFAVLHFATGTESLLAPGFDLSWRLRPAAEPEIGRCAPWHDPKGSARNTRKDLLILLYSRDYSRVKG